MSFPLDETERNRLAEEILGRLTISVSTEYPLNRQPLLRISLHDGNRKLCEDTIEIRALNLTPTQWRGASPNE